MTQQLQERFFILTPTPTGQTDKKTGHQVYWDASKRPMLWSAKFPIPEIGARVFIKLNSIGFAVVKGYFESHGYVGVMTLPENPPAWLKEQTKRYAKDMGQAQWVREGIGCEFGAEILLEATKAPKTITGIVMEIRSRLGNDSWLENNLLDRLSRISKLAAAYEKKSTKRRKEKQRA